MVITSLQNPKIKQAAALRERKQRKLSGLMMVEGHAELALAVACEMKPTTLFYCPAFWSSTADNVSLQEKIRATGAELLEVDKRVFEKMAYRENPDGWLAVLPLPHLELAELRLGSNPLLVVVEAVEKPGNLGAILRSADAAGVDGLLLCDPTVDIGNPNVVRSSRGTVFSRPIVETTSPQALAWLTAHNITVVAATPEAALPFTALDLRGPVAVVVGAERDGLSQVWRQGAMLTARIPMKGKVNSLNVAQATTLFLFEVNRQRG